MSPSNLIIFYQLLMWCLKKKIWGKNYNTQHFFSRKQNSNISLCSSEITPIMKKPSSQIMTEINDRCRLFNLMSSNHILINWIDCQSCENIEYKISASLWGIFSPGVINFKYPDWIQNYKVRYHISSHVKLQ